VSLYNQIGDDLIVRAVTEFYLRAFVDPLIGHFFHRKSITDITEKQIKFARGLLGGPTDYDGQPLETIHSPLKIRPPHFGRRQVLMAEVLEDLGLAPSLATAWLAREEKLRPLIMPSLGPAPCTPN